MNRFFAYVKSLQRYRLEGKARDAYTGIRDSLVGG
jgi:hypothetical protein